MFSKAKLKRFNEFIGCAPPPTKYNPLLKSSSVVLSLEKSARWKHSIDDVPGPGSYGSVNYVSTPIKFSRSGSSKEFFPNTSSISAVSTESSSSTIERASNFKGPLYRSASSRSFKVRTAQRKSVDIQQEISILTCERNALKKQLEDLNKKLESRCRIDTKDGGQNTTVNITDAVDLGIQVDLKVTDLKESKDSDTMKNANNVLFTVEEGSKLKQMQEQEGTDVTSESVPLNKKIENLTVMKNNFELSIVEKEDLIAELQVQLDQIVCEVRESQNEASKIKLELTAAEENLKKSIEEKNIAVNKVKSLIAQYEALSANNEDNKELMAQKDIEIELLNDTISTLNTKVADYEQQIGRLNEEVMDRLTEISQFGADPLSVDSTVNVENALFCDFNVSEGRNLKDLLSAVETRVSNLIEERNKFNLSVLEENQKYEQVEELKLQVKEKEVLQQFLEKEVTAREEEINALCVKVSEMEKEIDDNRKAGLELLQEAEDRLNSVLSLKAMLNAVDYDIESKDDLIASLKEELSKKNDLTLDLHEQIAEKSCAYEEKVAEYENKITELVNHQEVLSHLKISLQVANENLDQAEKYIKKLQSTNSQLEEEVVSLMAEIGDREAKYKNRMTELESEFDEISVKYSDALLEHDATRRALLVVTEQMEREKLLLSASEAELSNAREEISSRKIQTSNQSEQIHLLNSSISELKKTLESTNKEAQEERKKLETELDNVKMSLEESEAQIESVKSMNNGFISQITQLRIDINKKSYAVEELHVCIENLREEKSHLLSLRDNLEKSVEKKDKTITEMKDEINKFENEKTTLETNFNDLQVNFDALQSEQIASKEDIFMKQNAIFWLEEKLDLLEGQTRALTQERDALLEELAGVQHNLSSMKEELLRFDTIVLERNLEEVSNANKELEDNIEALNMEKSNLGKEMKEWKSKYLNLEKMVEPFREQLDEYEIEKNYLLSKSTEAQEEVEKLSREYARLLGHQNQKQKIHYVNKLKEENNQLKEEMKKLRKEIDIQKSSVRRLEDKLERNSKHKTFGVDSTDKENSRTLVPHNRLMRM